MKDLQIFKNAEFNIRAYGDWFVGMDVSRGLNYSNAYGALVKYVSKEDKKLAKIPGRNPRHDPNGGTPQNTIIISKSGVYSLIRGSNLVSASRFNRWFTNDVSSSTKKHVSPTNGLQVFQNNDFTVRVSTVDGKPYFSLLDVCKVLGLTNTGEVVRRLKGDGVISNDGVDSLGRKTVLSFINESNLYKVIFQSRKTQAQEFTEWVTSEVLPSIREHGAYMTPDVLEESINNPDYMIGLLNELKKNQKQIKEQAPKVQMAEELLMATDCIGVGSFAKTNGTGRTRLFRLLKEKKIVDPHCVAYQRYVDQGYFKVKESVKYGRTYVVSLITPKGQEWLLKTLRKEMN